LPSEDATSISVARCAKSRFLCLHNGELALDKRAIHSAAADLDIAKAPARYSAIGAVQSTARHLHVKKPDENQDSVKFGRSKP